MTTCLVDDGEGVDCMVVGCLPFSAGFCGGHSVDVGGTMFSDRGFCENVFLGLVLFSHCVWHQSGTTRNGVDFVLQLSQWTLLFWQSYSKSDVLLPPVEGGGGLVTRCLCRLFLLVTPFSR